MFCQEENFVIQRVHTGKSVYTCSHYEKCLLRRKIGLNTTLYNIEEKLYNCSQLKKKIHKIKNCDYPNLVIVKRHYFSAASVKRSWLEIICISYTMG